MPDTVGYNPADFEWEVAHEESPDQVIFNEIDDTYVGEYLGMDEIEFVDKKTGENKSFTQLRFRDPEGLKVINAGYELVEAYKEIPPNTVTMTRLAKFVDVGQQSPMKSYRVETAKSRGNTKGK